MKLIYGVVGMIVLCAGCASETGVYYENTGVVHYNTETLEVTPRFKVEKQKPAVADMGRDVLLGKWRVRMSKDYIIYKDRDDLLKNKNGGQSSQWEIYEYEFKGDGAYSIRGVARDGATLKGVGEDGKWIYANGVLHLQSEYCLSPGTFTFSEPNHTKVVKKIHCRVIWHSDCEFTLEYANPAEPTVTDYVTCIGMGLVGDARVPYFDRTSVLPKSGSHYDSSGCFHYRGLTGTFGEVSVVVNPQRFKRVK